MARKIFSVKVLYYFFILFTLTNCSEPSSEDSKIFNSLEESFSTSNQIISLSTNAQLNDLKEKSFEPGSQVRAMVWLPKAELISSFSKIRYDFIEKKKQKTKLNSIDLDEVFNTLNEYKKEVLGRDPELNEIFKSNFGFISNYKNLLSEDSLSEKIVLKNGLSKEKIKLVLVALQNEIMKVENKTIAFCNTKVGSNIYRFESFSTIIGQNTKYLRPGEELEITTGVGSFSHSGNPEIIINGKKRELNEKGFVVYKLKAKTKPGSYKIPVDVSFFNETIGKQEAYSFSVEYTVIKPCSEEN